MGMQQRVAAGGVTVRFSEDMRRQVAAVSQAEHRSTAAFDADEARRLNQKAFHLDLRALAYVALTPAWFPRLGEPDRRIVAVASKAIQLRIIEAGRALAGRREAVESRGIGSGTTTTRRRE